MQLRGSPNYAFFRGGSNVAGAERYLNRYCVYLKRYLHVQRCRNYLLGLSKKHALVEGGGSVSGVLLSLPASRSQAWRSSRRSPSRTHL